MCVEADASELRSAGWKRKIRVSVSSVLARSIEPSLSVYVVHNGSSNVLRSASGSMQTVISEGSHSMISAV